MRTVKSNLILKYRCIYRSTTEVDFSLSGIVLNLGRIYYYYSSEKWEYDLKGCFRVFKIVSSTCTNNKSSSSLI